MPYQSDVNGILYKIYMKDYNAKLHNLNPIRYKPKFLTS